MRYLMDFDEQIKAQGTGTLVAGFPAYTFTMKEPVDGDALQLGVEQSMRCHPLFCCHMVKHDEFEWETNELAPVVREIDIHSNFTYGDDSNNHYPWIVYYSGRNIVFTCTHALTDGMGACEFMKTALYCYCEHLG